MYKFTKKQVSETEISNVTLYASEDVTVKKNNGCSASPSAPINDYCDIITTNQGC